LVLPWTKKPFLYLLLHPLPPIRLVVVAVSQECGSRKLVVEVVVASLLLSPSEYRHRLERDAVALEVNIVVLVAPVVFVAPKATGLVLDAAFEFHAPLRVFGASIPVFLFPEDRLRSLRHCHWRHCLHCHCSSC